MKEAGSASGSQASRGRRLGAGMWASSCALLCLWACSGSTDVVGVFDDSAGSPQSRQQSSDTNATQAQVSGAGSNGATFPQSPISAGGSFIAWTGSQLNSGVTQLYRAISFPVGTTSVQVLVDTNFQTKSIATTNHDYFEVRLLDSSLVQVGTALAAFSNASAQTGTARAWTKDGINVTREASALAGKSAYLMFWTSVDTSVRSDFFVDNVRLIATVCK